MTEIKISFDGESQASRGASAAPGEGPSLPPDAASQAPVEEAQVVPEDEAVEVEEDLSELVKKAKQRDEYLALAQRTQADFENYRKRVAKEAAGAKERGVCALAKELLPALDNLDRALEAAAEDDPLLQGVRLVRTEMSAALARVGIESFSPVGEQFDPAVHEAVATAPAGAASPSGDDAEGGASEGHASGTVTEVYQAGYRLGDTVIRPARVVVAA